MPAFIRCSANVRHPHLHFGSLSSVIPPTIKRIPKPIEFAARLFICTHHLSPLAANPSLPPTHAPDLPRRSGSIPRQSLRISDRSCLRPRQRARVALPDHDLSV